MSGSINLNIATGSDWAVKMTWTDGAGLPVPFSNPVMDVRQELNPNGTLIAKLDSSGLLDGTISVASPGVLIMKIPQAKTTTLQTGFGFWDIFVTVFAARVRFAFGTVSISPHVTVAV